MPDERRSGYTDMITAISGLRRDIDERLTRHYTAHDTRLIAIEREISTVLERTQSIRGQLSDHSQRISAVETQTDRLSRQQSGRDGARKMTHVIWSVACALAAGVIGTAGIIVSWWHR